MLESYLTAQYPRATRSGRRGGVWILRVDTCSGRCFGCLGGLVALANQKEDDDGKDSAFHEFLVGLKYIEQVAGLNR